MNSEHRLGGRVEQLFDESQRVLGQCALENGAIIAGNSDLSVYPATAENYRFSWARDAAFQLLATHAINPEVARERALRYADWLQNVQGFVDTGLYLKRYATNGSLDVRYGEHYQPDQAGALIGALDTVVAHDEFCIDYTIHQLANGLTDKWNGQSLGPTQDLWENRETTRLKNDVFTYSLASVIHGLRRAIDRFDGSGTERWGKAVDEMTASYDSVVTRTYLRKIIPRASEADQNNTLDASLNGLVYPFAPAYQFEPSRIAKRTVLEIDRQLYQEGLGVHRYTGDTYDGIVRSNSQEARAGAWPLLTFWHAIALDTIGEPARARDVFWDQIDRLDFEYTNHNLPDNLIPEQLYPDSERQGRGVLPLAWSHAKFILAARALEVAEL